MSHIHVVYEGKMRERCELLGKQVVLCDQPKSLGGLEENGSPTDLFGAALASCMLTMMSFQAKRLKVAMEGASADVTKQLTTSAPFKIVEIKVTIQMPAGVPQEARKALEEAAMHCPIHLSLSHEVNQEVSFVWI